MHTVVDAQGLPIRLGLTAGQTHDGQIADTLLDHLGQRTMVLADKAYDADRIRELIQDQGATPNIPPKSNRRWKPCFSRRLFRERILIERFFSKLKHFRRVGTRCDKLTANFLAMIQLACVDSTPEAIAGALERYGSVDRGVIETGRMAPAIALGLRERGVAIVCIDARQAHQS